jgi:hypothetical protein
LEKPVFRGFLQREILTGRQWKAAFTNCKSVNAGSIPAVASNLAVDRKSL